jgi:hypothetical protein
MDLLDRYLGAVAALLPRAQRDDIIAELRDLLLNRFEEKEAELGRPLTEAEREAVLKDYGHPVAVAGRYDSHQHLIGPGIYPYYVFALKIGLSIVAIISVILAIGAGIANGAEFGRIIPRAISGFVSAGITMVGLFTITAVAIERWGVRLPFLDDWRPRDLPVIPAGFASVTDWSGFGLSGGAPRTQATQPAAGATPPGFGWGHGWSGPGGPAAGWQTRSLTGEKGLGNNLFELAANVLFILWWTGLLHFPMSAIDTAGGDAWIVPGAAWTTFHDLILAAVVGQTVVCVLDIVRPGWVRARAAATIAANAFSLYVLYLLWQSGPLFDIQSTVLDSVELAKLKLGVGWAIQGAFLVFVAVWVGESIGALVRLIRGAPRANGNGAGNGMAPATP